MPAEISGGNANIGSAAESTASPSPADISDEAGEHPLPSSSPLDVSGNDMIVGSSSSPAPVFEKLRQVSADEELPQAGTLQQAVEYQTDVLNAGFMAFSVLLGIMLGVLLLQQFFIWRK